MTIKLKFEYSKEYEFTRVKDTLASLDWYNSHGYKPRLPAGINRESSREEIVSQINKEYEAIRYSKMENEIIAAFSVYDEKFTHKLIEVFGKDIPKTFLVRLTNYGVGGSYNLPDVVIFNINMKKGIKTIVHEIIHLLIQNQIDKYKVQQWEKERIVDLILNSKEFDFLNYNEWQSDYHGAEKYIDDLFNQYFFDNRENFFSKIDGVRQKE